MKWCRRDSERTRGRIIRVVKMKKEREEKRKKEKRGEEIEIWEGINRKERMLCHAMTRCSIVHYTRTYAQIYMYTHTYIHTFIHTYIHTYITHPLTTSNKLFISNIFFNLRDMRCWTFLPYIPLIYTGMRFLAV